MHITWCRVEPEHPHSFPTSVSGLREGWGLGQSHSQGGGGAGGGAPDAQAPANNVVQAPPTQETCRNDAF